VNCEEFAKKKIVTFPEAIGEAALLFPKLPPSAYEIVLQNNKRQAGFSVGNLGSVQFPCPPPGAPGFMSLSFAAVTAFFSSVHAASEPAFRVSHASVLAPLSS